jgi:hypothetical protein
MLNRTVAVTPNGASSTSGVPGEWATSKVPENGKMWRIPASESLSLSTARRIRASTRSRCHATSMGCIWRICSSSVSLSTYGENLTKKGQKNTARLILFLSLIGLIDPAANRALAFLVLLRDLRPVETIDAEFPGFGDDPRPICRAQWIVSWS